jgi:hypothetical protein
MENKVCGVVCQPHIPNVLLRYLIKYGRETDVHVVPVFSVSDIAYSTVTVTTKDILNCTAVQI